MQLLCYNKFIKQRGKQKVNKNPRWQGVCKGGESNQNLTLHPIIYKDWRYGPPATIISF